MSQENNVSANPQDQMSSAPDAGSSTVPTETAPKNLSVLFLDFDGVLNSVQSTILSIRKGAVEHTVLDEVACSNLQYILECLPELKIVISSSWRKLFDLQWIKDHLRKYGVDSERVIDRTPFKFSSRPRGYEIQEFLDDWKEEHPNQPIEKFVIVDDDADMKHLLPNLVQTNNNIGLTFGKAQDIVKAFGGSAENWNPSMVFPYYLLEAGRECSPPPPEDVKGAPKTESDADKLMELVVYTAKTKTTDEAWEASERCFDYLHEKMHPEIYKEPGDGN